MHIFLRCIHGGNSVVSDSIVSLGAREVYIYVVKEMWSILNVKLFLYNHT